MDLSQFTGSETWYRWSPLSQVIASEGMMHVAETAGAYWLLDAIASHEEHNPELLAACEDASFDYLHFWYLEVSDGQAVLSCARDKGEEPVVVQRIEYTDFPHDLTIYAGNDGRGTRRKLFLPSEY